MGEQEPELELESSGITKKGSGSSTAERNSFIATRGPGLVPGNVEGNLCLAHFTI